ncbi:NADH-dependent methylglyoxal reductase [Yinghuangia aomiensis]|uniref:NADH-dependent methylglyoxal reductase n=1 Tax=Yinghuangia aomiensis TaxID=676205 RepID=A0ABP9IC12_9ACTN
MTTRSSGAGRRVLAGGLEVNPLGVGCWAIGGPDHNLGLPMGWTTADDDRARAALERAFELGANLFDTADVYGHGHSERLVGSLLRQVPREEVVVSSKVGYLRDEDHPYEPRQMRRHLESTLDNLGVDYLDAYFFHNADFGEKDRYLAGAVEQMRDFQRQGLVRAVGMRGPHRFATERLQVAKAERDDKHARFHRLFEAIRPQLLAVRFNALTPVPAGARVFAFARRHGVSVLVNKPLAQGLLTGKHTAVRPPRYGDGDHRNRKRWFTRDALTVIEAGLAPLRERFGGDRAALVRVALRYCLQQDDNAAVLVGFTCEEHVEQNLTCLGEPLTEDELAFVRAVGARLQHELDSSGEVFLDEVGTERDGAGQ